MDRTERVTLERAAEVVRVDEDGVCVNGCGFPRVLNNDAAEQAIARCFRALLVAAWEGPGAREPRADGAGATETEARALTEAEIDECLRAGCRATGCTVEDTADHLSLRRDEARRVVGGMPSIYSATWTDAVRAKAASLRARKAGSADARATQADLDDFAGEAMRQGYAVPDLSALRASLPAEGATFPREPVDDAEREATTDGADYDMRCAATRPDDRPLLLSMPPSPTSPPPPRPCLPGSRRRSNAPNAPRT